MSLRVGIIGAGYWGEKLYRVFGAHPAVEVAVVADLDRDRRQLFADQVAVSESPQDLWANAAIDAVVVATPPSTHFELARAGLEARKHCWIEKPLALVASEARTLVDLGRQTDRVLFVDETFLYDPLIRRARGWIEEGRLGEILHVSCERLSLGRVRRDSDIWWNAAPHDLSILTYLIPAAVREIHVERFTHLQAGIADACVASMRLDGGITAHLYLSWMSPLKRASTVVIGTKGMLAYEGRFGQRALTRHEYALDDSGRSQDNVVAIRRFELVETVVGGSEEPLALAVAAFVERITHGVPAPSEGVHSCRVVELLERGANS